MNTNKNFPRAAQLSANQTEITKVNFLHLPLKIAGKDVRLNVNFKDSMIRFGITMFLPMIMLLIDYHMIIYTAPVMAYLFISAITHFCVIKYIWHRYIKHDPPAALPPYGENPDFPEESV
jgi:hypothetical protein